MQTARRTHPTLRFAHFRLIEFLTESGGGGPQTIKRKMGHERTYLSIHVFVEKPIHGVARIAGILDLGPAADTQEPRERILE